MIRPLKPEELEMVCGRITSIDPWLTLDISAEELITGMRMDTIRKILVYDDGVSIAGAVVYRPQHGAELLFFHNLGSVLAQRYGVQWPCKWTDVPGFGYIGSLAVFDGMTGQGIGLRLLQAAQEKIREAGMSTAFLCVSDFNTRAQKFYKRHGYTCIGKAQGKRSVEHLMEKAL